MMMLVVVVLLRQLLPAAAPTCSSRASSLPHTSLKNCSSVMAQHGAHTASSPAECCRRCASLGGCVAWTCTISLLYNASGLPTADGTCTLLSGTGGCARLFDPSAASGVIGGDAPWPPAQPPPRPPRWARPLIHNAPACLSQPGWHDIAGALTHQGVHHVFQGCPHFPGGSLADLSGGWHHASSPDLVHWQDRGMGPTTRTEQYEGMHSHNYPCSGFVTVDDADVPCAGFRQCHSLAGTTELNPAAHKWDVPLELRCATDANLTAWGPSEYLYPVYFYRSLPYDPIRPWRDLDGKWYSAISADACNGTTKSLPCAAGGQLDMWTSDALHGPNANWRHLGALFTTSLDVLPSAHLRKEFTTSNFFGGIPGDPLDGRTRVITNGGAAEDGGSTEYYIGTQEPGSKFVLGRGEHAVGMIDWGSFAPVDGSSRGLAGLRGTHSRGQSMCRTLGGDANQVAVKGRRVMVCWMGGPGGVEPRHPGWPTQALQSLSREISLSSESELLQQFVPEYRALRTTVLPAATADESHVGTQLISGTHLEIACTFSVLPGGNHSAAFGVSVFAASDDGRRRTDLLVDLRRGYFTLDATAQGELSPRSGPVRGSTARISMHAILDGNAIEAIFNNRTAISTPQVADLREGDSGVRLFGVGDGVNAKLEVWELRQANNFEAERDEQA